LSLLEVTNLNFKYSDKQLFNDVNLRIFNNEHVVLVGPNGTGKSTFLKLLYKEIKPDSGNVDWLGVKKVGYLDQYVKINSETVVKDYIYAVFNELFKKEAQMIELYDQVNKTNNDTEVEKLINYAASIQDDLIENDFYAIKSLVNSVIYGLGLDEEVLDMKVKHLSGGMRAKIILAKLLLEENDVLLLDEPTNFLDIMHIDFLATFLNEYKKAFIVVSHDVSFIKRIANVVIAIENSKINRYKGDYDFYLKERLIRFDHHQKAYESQQRLIKETKEFIDKNIVRASTTKRAQSRRKMLEKIDKISKVKKDPTYHFEFITKSSNGIDVLKIENLEIGYNNEALVDKLNFIIRNKEKVVVTGKNGVGKSTFIKTVLNKIPKISGNYSWIETANISYLEQDSFFTTSDSAFAAIHYKYPNLSNTEVMSLLASYGINYEMANRALNTLSGGEQTKVKLALLKYEYGNVLILDEPTNHLDVNAKEALKEALINYQGTLILVSHEKDFYEEICDYEIMIF